MVMKKLIVFSVVFALVAGAAFAVDLSGGVIGTVNFLEGDSQKDKNGDAVPVGASAGFDRVRLEGSGENDDGTFGGWLRVEGLYAGDVQQSQLTGNSWEDEVLHLFKGYGYAWWKPLDLLKVGIGGNPDGMYGKEGVTGWGFYQTASDTGVVNPGNAWGGSYLDGDALVFRNAFYGGFGANALHLTISPVDMVDINIAVPFFDGVAYDPDTNPEGSASYIFQRTVFQADLKLDFGNIALTYVGDGNKYADGNPGTIFAYFGLTSIENLGIDVGIGFPLPLVDKEFMGADSKEHTATIITPIAVGLGAKFTTGAFGIKARVVASFAGSSKVDYDGDAGDPDPDPFLLIADILPFYSVSDNLRIYFSAGLGIAGVDKDAKGDPEQPKDAWGDDTKAVVAWHINPYVEVGGEWGPKFLAGLKLSSDGKDYANLKDSSEKEKIVKWSIPIALHVSF